MMSPGWASSGRMTASSPTAQLARFSRVPRHSPSCQLNLSEMPAQVGQAILSPGLAPAGTSRACPHSGQGTVAAMVGFPPRSWYLSAQTLDPEEALQLPPVKADHDLPVHHDDRGRHPPGKPHHLLPRGRVLRNINAAIRNPLGRKKLFGCVAGCSGRGRVDRHARIGHSSPFPRRLPPRHLQAHHLNRCRSWNLPPPQPEAAEAPGKGTRRQTRQETADEGRGKGPADGQGIGG